MRLDNWYSYSFTHTARVLTTRPVRAEAPAMNLPFSVNARYPAPTAARPPKTNKPVRRLGLAGTFTLVAKVLTGPGHDVVKGVVGFEGKIVRKDCRTPSG